MDVEPAISKLSSSSEAFIFVVDGPLLEQQSVLLATSLAKVHKGISNARIYAYVSERSEKLPKLVRAVYENAGVRIRKLPSSSEIFWAKPYPHGNKIKACAAFRSEARTTFIDTDVLVTKAIFGLANRSDEVLAVPEGVPSWGKGDQWERAYSHVGLKVPEERVTLVRGRGIQYPPYFNAGFISFPERKVHGLEKRFSQLWLSLALDFDHKCPIKNKRPWLDQITLPLTLYKFGFPWSALSDYYNYSLSNRDKVKQREKSAHILHYHSLKFLASRPIYSEIRQEILQWLPNSLAGDLDAALPTFHGSVSQIT